MLMNSTRAMKSGGQAGSMIYRVIHSHTPTCLGLWSRLAGAKTIHADLPGHRQAWQPHVKFARRLPASNADKVQGNGSGLARSSLKFPFLFVCLLKGSLHVCHSTHVEVRR